MGGDPFKQRISEASYSKDVDVITRGNRHRGGNLRQGDKGLDYTGALRVLGLI